jgi:hypothetical protein
VRARAPVVVNSWAVAIYLTFNQVNCVNRRRVYCSPTGCWRRDRVVPLWKRAAELYAPLFLCRFQGFLVWSQAALEGWDDEPGIFPSVMSSNDLAIMSLRHRFKGGISLPNVRPKHGISMPLKRSIRPFWEEAKLFWRRSVLKHAQVLNVEKQLFLGVVIQLFKLRAIQKIWFL